MYNIFLIVSFCYFRIFKNVEEAVEYLFALDDTPADTGIDIALEPPDEGDDTDVDDPSEDIVDIGGENVNLLGPRLLARPAHVELTNRHHRPRK